MRGHNENPVRIGKTAARESDRRRDCSPAIASATGKSTDINLSGNTQSADTSATSFVVKKRLIVEADGGQHNDSAADAIRDRRLNEEGYRVLRFWNNDVLGNIDGVLATIQTELLKYSCCGALQPRPACWERSDRIADAGEGVPVSPFASRICGGGPSPRPSPPRKGRGPIFSPPQGAGEREPRGAAVDLTS